MKLLLKKQEKITWVVEKYNLTLHHFSTIISNYNFYSAT